MASARLLSSTVFRLGVLGARWEEAFASSIEAEGIRPKHVAVLAVLREGVPRTQQDLAEMMGVGPSLVVALATDLENRGAIVRERDADDRRRQRLRLTSTGESLLDRCEASMSQLDDAIARALGRLAPALDDALAALETVPRPDHPSERRADSGRALRSVPTRSLSRRLAGRSDGGG